jgi:hypothetical protein
MGVPQIDMSEMTGNVAVNIRKEAWCQSDQPYLLCR